MALTGGSQTQGVAGPYYIAGFEFDRIKFEKRGDAKRVLLRQVDKARLVTAPDTTWLAFEPEGLSQIVTVLICFGCVCHG